MTQLQYATHWAKTHLCPTSLVRTYGLQEALLFLAGPIWIGYGLGALLGVSGGDLGAPHLALWAPIRVSLWVSAGILSMISCPRPQHRQMALSALMIMPMVRFCSYLWAWIGSWEITGDILPGDLAGTPDGWYFALVHLPLILIVIAIRFIPRDIGKERDG